MRIIIVVFIMMIMLSCEKRISTKVYSHNGSNNIAHWTLLLKESKDILHKQIKHKTIYGTDTVQYRNDTLIFNGVVCQKKPFPNSEGISKFLHAKGENIFTIFTHKKKICLIFGEDIVVLYNTEENNKIIHEILQKDGINFDYIPPPPPVFKPQNNPHKQ